MRLGVLVPVVVVAGGCAGEATDEEVGGGAAALAAPVTWMNAVGVSAVDDDLTKTATQTQWNAGAASVQSLAGDGYAEFTTGESSTIKAVGLSVGDSGQDLGDIDFALYLKATGNVDIYEGGVEVARNVDTYAAGDLFRVQVLGGVVTYWHDGALVHTSAAAPGSPLRVDTALRTPGATVQNVRLQDLTFWTNAVGVVAVGSDLEKSAPETTWKAGASSLAALDGDGHVEFTTGERTTDKVAGLNRVDKNQGYRDIDFGIFLRANGRIAIREKGVDPVGAGFGPYQAGDVFRIEVSGGVVTYAKNGVVFYTSEAVPSFPLVLDTSLRTPGATILDALVVPATGCSAFDERLRQTNGGELAVDADGDWLAVSNGEGSPAPYLAMYRRLPTGLVREALLSRNVPSGSRTDSVAIDGDTVAVGSPTDDTFGGFEGAVRTYRYDGTGWSEESHFAGCPEIDDNEAFGASVGVAGDVLVVGNRSSSSPQFPAGNAYVYRRNGGGWDLEAILTPSDPVDSRLFGMPVAIGGDRIFVGDLLHGESDGAVYVFRYDGGLPDPGTPPTCAAPHQGKWVEEAIIESPNAQTNAGFPSDMDVSSTGASFIVGNPQEETGPGEAYIFTRADGEWGLSATLTGSGTVPGDELGRAVAFGGEDPANPTFAIVTAPSWPIGTSEPAAYLFATDGETWSEVDRLVSAGPRLPSRYGLDAAARGTAVFLPEDGQSGAESNKSAVYVHEVGMCMSE